MFTKQDKTVTKKIKTRDSQITFIHQFKRAKRTAWSDRFLLCWYFNPETFYIAVWQVKLNLINTSLIQDIFCYRKAPQWGAQYHESLSLCAAYRETNISSTATPMQANDKSNNLSVSA